jgi:hypothetical protein
VHREDRAKAFILHFLTSELIFISDFPDYEILFVVLFLTVAINAVANSIVLTSKERRHTLLIGVSIGVPCRRVPRPIVLLSVLDCMILMAVR